MNSMIRSQASRRRKGFTLTEIAIVLGIIGLILGAIWVAASAVFGNQRLAKANTEILQIVQGARTLYATSSVTGEANGTALTASLVNANVFPSDLVSGTTGLTPWGGTTRLNVYSQTASVTGDAILIELTNLSTAACVGLLTGLTGSGRDAGLWKAYANSATQATGTHTTTSTFPISLTTANTSCTASSAFVGFLFKLQG
jgi:prepilin-type N-terminal cleavage/methylation domain-containing protein